MLLDEKDYDEALDAARGEARARRSTRCMPALKGDILVAQGQDGRGAGPPTSAALEKAGERSAAFRASVQLRLDALGG